MKPTQSRLGCKGEEGHPIDVEHLQRQPQGSLDAIARACEDQATRNVVSQNHKMWNPLPHLRITDSRLDGKVCTTPVDLRVPHPRNQAAVAGCSVSSLSVCQPFRGFIKRLYPLWSLRLCVVLMGLVVLTFVCRYFRNQAHLLDGECHVSREFC